MRNYLNYLPEGKRQPIVNPKSVKTTTSEEANLDYNQKEFEKAFSHMYNSERAYSNGVMKFNFERTKAVPFINVIKESRKYKKTLANHLFNGRFSKTWNVKQKTQKRTSKIIVSRDSSNFSSVEDLQEVLSKKYKLTVCLSLILLLDYILLEYGAYELNLNENKIVVGKQTMKASKLFKKTAAKYGYDEKATDELLQTLTTKQAKSTAITGVFTLKVEEFLFQSPVVEKSDRRFNSCHREGVHGGALGKGDYSSLPWLAQGWDYSTAMAYLLKGGELENALSRRAVYINSDEKTYALGRAYPDLKNWETGEGKEVMDNIHTAMKNAGYTRHQLKNNDTSYFNFPKIAEIPAMTMFYGDSKSRARHNIWTYHDFKSKKQAIAAPGVVNVTHKDLETIIPRLG